MRFGKLLLATIGATALLGALVGSASARSFSTSSQTFRALFTNVIFQGVFGRIICEVQAEGSLHTRTIAKVNGSLIGYITAARILRCAENSATILAGNLPWHVRYTSFTGTLPNITSIRTRAVGVAFQIREPLFTCLAFSTEEAPVVIGFARESGGVVSTAEIGGTVTTICEMFFIVEGSFSSNRAPVSVLNSASRITVTLI